LTDFHISPPGSRSRRRPFFLLAACMVLASLGVVVARYWRNADHHGTINLSVPTQQADVATVPPTFTPDAGVIIYDRTGLYAFPVAADPRLYTWTHYHWDGTHAADIEARFGLDQADFVLATSAQLVAVTNGLLVSYSGKKGGLGYILHGDDGLDYYYGHMAEQWVPDKSHVTTGQPLGLIGNSGTTAQFIEPHLHFAIGPRDTLWEQMPTVNAAEWLHSRFGLDWQERPAKTIAYDYPQGWPVQHPDLVIVTSYAQAAAHGLPQPALEFGFTGQAPAVALDVIATLNGEANVIRWTACYGNRIQITNQESDMTVVISGVDEWLVEDGAAVSRDQVIGRWNPSSRPRLNYMIFQDGTLIDPAPTLGLQGGSAESAP
jgi:hypothetical protein